MYLTMTTETAHQGFCADIEYVYQSSEGKYDQGLIWLSRTQSPRDINLVGWHLSTKNLRWEFRKLYLDSIGGAKYPEDMYWFVSCYNNREFELFNHFFPFCWIYPGDVQIGVEEYWATPYSCIRTFSGPYFREWGKTAKSILEILDIIHVLDASYIVYKRCTGSILAVILKGWGCWRSSYQGPRIWAIQRYWRLFEYVPVETC